MSEPPSDAEVFGYEGKHLIVQVPADIEFDPARGFVGCNESSFFGWRAGEIGRPEGVLTRYYQAPGQRLEFWVLDVEGTVLLIERSSYEDSPPEHVAELDSLIDTLRIET